MFGKKQKPEVINSTSIKTKVDGALGMFKNALNLLNEGNSQANNLISENNQEITKLEDENKALHSLVNNNTNVIKNISDLIGEK